MSYFSLNNIHNKYILLNIKKYIYLSTKDLDYLLCFHPIRYNKTMSFQTLKEGIARFVNSIAYIGILAFLSFLCWVVKGNWIWCFLPIYALLCFLPLFCEDGRGYLPLVLFPIFITNTNIHFKGGIPIGMVFAIAIFVFSLGLFLLIKRPKMITGSIFFSLLALYCVFLFSFFYSTIRYGKTGRVGILYLIAMFLLLCIYALMNSALGKKETIPYFSEAMVCFSLAASTEVFVAILKESALGLASINFTLGWSYTRETVSSILTLSLPFFSVLISKKKPIWLVPELFVLTAIFLLSTDSSLLSLLFFAIPNIILTLKDYSRSYPYYVMLCLLVIGSTFGILMGISETFSLRIAKAVSRLNFFSEDSLIYFKPAIDSFLKNPLLGQSISSIVRADGTILLPNNTILSVLQLGGSIGFICFLAYEISLYVVISRKDTKQKWLFLLFCLNVELIGLIDNTIFNIAILLIALMTFSVYQQSNRLDEVQIHDDYFTHYEAPNDYSYHLHN